MNKNVCVAKKNTFFCEGGECREKKRRTVCRSSQAIGKKKVVKKDKEYKSKIKTKKEKTPTSRKLTNTRNSSMICRLPLLLYAILTSYYLLRQISSSSSCHPSPCVSPIHHHHPAASCQFSSGLLLFSPLFSPLLSCSLSRSIGLPSPTTFARNTCRFHACEQRKQVWKVSLFSCEVVSLACRSACAPTEPQQRSHDTACLFSIVLSLLQDG